MERFMRAALTGCAAVAGTSIVVGGLSFSSHAQAPAAR